MKKINLLKMTACAAIVAGLAACGEPAPAAFNANLDVDCNPQDPLDKVYASLAPEGFWRAQEYDMGLMMSSTRKNIELSRAVLNDSIAQRADYFNRAQQAASDLGLSGAARRDHVKDNMDRYEAEVKDIQDRLEMQERTMSWLRQCTRSVDDELRKLGLEPQEFDPTRRP